MAKVHAYIDPSAWVKRYFNEDGTELMNVIFDTLLKPRPSHLICSRIGIAEVVSVLNRRRNAGAVSQSVFNIAYSYFEEEARVIRLISVTNYMLDLSIRAILTHNLNATDALHLQVAIETSSRFRRQGEHLLFISSDKRLLKVSQNEGLSTFNPETGTKTHLEKLLQL